MQEYVFEKGVWTPVASDFVQRQILEKGLTVAGIAAWKPNVRQSISSFTDPSKVRCSGFGVSGIRYTGRAHTIKNVTFYEADLLRNDMPKAGTASYLSSDWASEILREAENLLRERHGLPRIGESWVAETNLFNIVRELFPEAVQHASSRWLRLQHLDIFVPSKRLAIEYQGRQDFEPIDFFGGVEGYEATVKRDKQKRKKCEAQGVRLLYWKYDEPITKEAVVAKLELEKLV